MFLRRLDTYRARLSRLQRLVEEADACGLLLARSGNVYWATGLEGTLLLTREEAYLLIPPLEYLRVSEQAPRGLLEVVVYQPYRLPSGLELGGEPRIIEAKLHNAVEKLLGKTNCKLLVDGLGYDLAGKLAEKYTLQSVSDRVAEERMVKEPWEVELIERAAWIAEKALARALEELRPGVSELEVAAVIEYEFRSLGAEDHSFPTIVAFGENTVYPHARPSDRRRLSKNTPVLIDLGARFEGYCSDMTRTLCYGSCPPELVKTIEAVDEAFWNAYDAVEPGKKAEEVDRVARETLEKHGLAKYFNHSLGHGIGVEVHEAPRLAPGSKTVLREGMVFTIEPGVYIPGKRVGIRIEDTVAIVNGRPRRLTKLPHTL